MTKYHVRQDGTVGICRATKGKCPLGESRHFDNEETANKVSQIMMEEKYGVANVSEEEVMKAEMTESERRDLKQSEQRYEEEQKRKKEKIKKKSDEFLEKAHEFGQRVDNADTLKQLNEVKADYEGAMDEVREAKVSDEYSVEDKEVNRSFRYSTEAMRDIMYNIAAKENLIKERHFERAQKRKKDEERKLLKRGVVPDEVINSLSEDEKREAEMQNMKVRMLQREQEKKEAEKREAELRKKASDAKLAEIKRNKNKRTAPLGCGGGGSSSGCGGGC